MQRTIVPYQIAFVHALRQQLRGLDPFAELAGLTPQQERTQLMKERVFP